MFVGDSHGDLQYCSKMVKTAVRYKADRILQVGDFGIWPGTSGFTFLNALNYDLEKADLPWYFIGGNHEDYNQLHEFIVSGNLNIRPKITYIPNGSRWTWEDKVFGAIGGAFSVDFAQRVPWKSWWPDLEEAHPEDLVKLGKDKLDVFVCHDTPYAVYELRQFQAPEKLEIPSQKTRVILQEAVLTTNPEIIIHGHWHKRLSYDYHGIAIEALGANVGWTWNSVPDIFDAYGILDTETMQFLDGHEIHNLRKL